MLSPDGRISGDELVDEPPMLNARHSYTDYGAPGRRVTYLSFAVNLVLAVLKCLAGFFGRSAALMADGLHSFSDLASDVMVLFGLRMAGRPRDEDHPYGHHRFNTFAAAGVALMILLFALWMCLSALHALRTPAGAGPALWAAWAALLSIAAKEALFFVTRAVARRLGSRLLLANAWHHRTDSFSSVVTLAAVLVASLGGDEWRFVDALAGLALGIWLFIEGAGLLRGSFNDLLDRAPAREIINDLREHILPTAGVVGYHHFRARNVGDLVEVDLHLQVDPRITVEEGHEIARSVRENIMRKHPEVLDVLIHVEPATDEHLREDGVADFRKPGR